MSILGEVSVDSCDGGGRVRIGDVRAEGVEIFSAPRRHPIQLLPKM
jgi:hypothetical protein